MSETKPEPDLLQAIPSPSTRLWVGLCAFLSVFIIFAVYAIHEVRWLEDFQANVVQKNRKDSLQLLRLQNDSYLLAVSMRDMTVVRPRYPILDWKSEFTRLREDMDNALTLEGQYALSSPAGNSQRAQLPAALEQFWNAAGEAFELAQNGQEAAARKRFQTDLENKRGAISEIVARSLVLNDQAQAEAAERINAVYGNVKKDILVVIGALFLFAATTGLFTLQANRKTFMRLHHLAEQLQAQSAQLRKLSWKLIDLQEETLRRVGRDLHDEFGQILTAVGIMLGRAGLKLPGADPQLRSDLEAAQGVVEQTLQKIRDRSQMFLPAILDDFGLGQTLEWFTAQFSKQTGTRVYFESKLPDPSLPREHTIHLYRIVQEALSNVARHSRAREAWVTLEDRDGELRLEIRDNGIGFSTNGERNVAAGEGFGLMGMQERAQYLHGTLTISSAPRDGTTVTVRVPLPIRSLPPAAETVG